MAYRAQCARARTIPHMSDVAPQRPVVRYQKAALIAEQTIRLGDPRRAVRAGRRAARGRARRRARAEPHPGPRGAARPAGDGAGRGDARPHRPRARAVARRAHGRLRDPRRGRGLHRAPRGSPITDEEIAELWASCERFAAHVPDEDRKPLIQENLVFHDGIHRASRNRRAPEIIRALLEMPLLYASYTWYSLERRRVSEEHHRAITRALEARDGDRAGALMREHVLEAGRAALDASQSSH